MMYKALIFLIVAITYILFVNFLASHLSNYETIIRMTNRASCENGFFYHYQKDNFGDNKKPLKIQQVRESEKVCPKYE